MVDQLMVVTPELTVSKQSDWLQQWGIQNLVDEGAKYWDQHKSSPDIYAIKMRSRQSEATTLLSGKGFGGFISVEWCTSDVLT
jgi:hypothetical protein